LFLGKGIADAIKHRLDVKDSTFSNLPDRAMKSYQTLIWLPIWAVLASCSHFRKPSSPEDEVTPAPPYEEASRFKCEPDLEALNQMWLRDGVPPVTRIEDAFRVTVEIGDRTIEADTHLFGKVRVIPYATDDDAEDAKGNPVGRGDAILSTYFPPGEIGITVEHHRPEFRRFSLTGDENPEELKEHFKLQDSHVGLLIGVQRKGAPGVITLNNPQSFEDGGLGEPTHPRLYLSPSYPWYLGKDRKIEFRDNIRTMAMGFNAVSNFPEDYNGGDPLGARNPTEVREHVRRMVRAIGGDEASREWFRDPEHMLYCSEFAHVSFSAGLIVPLNEETITALAGAEWWRKFAREVEKHNAGQPSAFTELNSNPNAPLVTLALAPAGLKPAAEYAPPGSKDDEKLAFEPMTMADIIESFMVLHFPRSLLGENLASAQSLVFQKLQPALLEIMAMTELPPSDPQRLAVQSLFDRIAAVVGQEYPNYASFRSALAPLLAEARQMSGPRGDNGIGLFVPPPLMHLVAKGHHKGGLLGLDYVGHGLHWSILDRVEPTDLFGSLSVNP
jgi:hypothetical protein